MRGGAKQAAYRRNPLCHARVIAALAGSGCRLTGQVPPHSSLARIAGGLAVGWALAGIEPILRRPDIIEP
jgi:hypothetical protein